jgi:dipeptidase E
MEQIETKLFGADIVYVGGGNTLYMMRVWRRLGVDRILKAAYHRGTILAGVSAGAICWFDSGHSDSMSFYNPQHWNYINVRGLGLVRGIGCPHYNGGSCGVPRRRAFREMVRTTGGMGIAIENNCAIAFIDDRYYRVIRSNDRARAYRVYKKRGGDVVAEQIGMQEQLAMVESLRNCS